MSVIRINKNKDYTVLSNYHLKDVNLSLKAKGLLSVMLSLPDGWDYSVSGLVIICKENETCINSTLKELKEFGYLVVTKLMPNETKSGRIEYVYDVYEKPKQEGEKQDLEILGVEILGVENQEQLNTNKLNTNKSNINNNIEKDTKEKAFNDFWSKYPNKKAKPNAYKSFMKIDPKEYEKIMNSLDDYINSKEWKEQNGRFIPYPATWLNQQRWNDKVEKEKSYEEWFDEYWDQAIKEEQSNLKK